MQIIKREYKVFSIDELSEAAREKAIQSLCNINTDYGWWDQTYEDAKMIGLTITEFDIDRGAYCKGKFINSATDTIDLILKEHGDMTKSYKTALQYKKELEAIPEEQEDEREEKQEEFLQSLLGDYLIILQKNYEYATSDEAILETIEANEYTFLEDGTMFY